VPNAAEDVEIISGYIFAPRIDGVSTYTATGNKLTIEPGTMLTISDGELYAFGDVEIWGELTIDHANAIFEILGDINWNIGSTSTILEAGLINVYGDWQFSAGSDVYLFPALVRFVGLNIQSIITHEPSSWFGNVEIDKGAESVTHDAGSTAQLSVIDFQVTSGAFFSDTPVEMYVEGNFSNYAICELDYGEVVFDGSMQTIDFSSPGYFNNLTITPSDYVELATNINIHGTLRIEDGILDVMHNQINIWGNWFNVVGPDGFIEGNGRVVFDNPTTYSLITTSETFNILEVDIAETVKCLLPGRVITCNKYDWTSGGITIEKSTFNALDLTQDGLYGTFESYLNGEINLTQDINGFVDLSGHIYIYGGSINVYGGKGDSWWAYDDDATITMTSGVLDFKDQGIYLCGYYSLSENIIGGTIRTTGKFTGVIDNFQPSGGTVELYGPNDRSVYIGSTSYFHSLNINKSGSDKGGNRASTITATGPITIKGDLTISNGVFDPNGQSIYIYRNWNNLVGDAGFVEDPSSVDFVGDGASLIGTDETFYFFNLSKSGSGYVSFQNDVTISVIHGVAMYDGLIRMYDNTTFNIGGDLDIGLNSGLNTSYGTNVNINCNWLWMNFNSTFAMDHGFHPGTSTVTFTRDGDQYLETAGGIGQFYNLVIGPSSGGKFYTKDNVIVMGDFELNRQWSDDVANRTHSFHGNFNVPSGGAWPFTSGQTVIFAGTNDQNVNCPIARGQFYNITIDKTPAKSKALIQSNVIESNLDDKDDIDEIIPTVRLLSHLLSSGTGDIDIDEGLLSLNGHNLYTTGDITVNDGGYLFLNPNAELHVSDNKTLSVRSGGVVSFLGTEGNKALLTHYSSGYYDFNINSGATISAQHAIFEYGGYNGVYVMSGAAVYGTYPFSHCTFRYGSDIGGTAFLVINNDQHLEIFNADFPSAKKAATFNVVKEFDNGSIKMYNATGVFEGPAHEGDPHSLIFWYDPSLLVSPLHRDVTDLANPTSFSVSNSGDGDMDWTATVLPASSSWLSITGGTSGTNTGTIDVAFETNTGSARTGYIIIDCPYALNSPIAAEVRQAEAEYYIDIPSDTLVTTVDTCVAAKRVIKVPASGGSYLISNNASMTLIAGDSILLKDGFHAANGSYFNAFISDLPCVLKNPPLVIDKIEIEEEKQQLFKVYPNPATREIGIELVNELCESGIHIEIYNTLGKAVYKMNNLQESHLNVNISNLDAGLYFVKAICGEEVFLKKFVKY